MEYSTEDLWVLPNNNLNLKKVGQEDIARTVIHLASDDLVGHLSGQTITVAGGMEVRVLFVSEEGQ